MHRFASLARDLIHVHLMLCSAVENNCKLSVRTVELVAGFYWFDCPGFKEPAHLGQGYLPAPNAGWLRLRRNRQNWIYWSVTGGGGGEELSVGSHHLSHHLRQGLLRAMGGIPQTGAQQSLGVGEPTPSLGNWLGWFPGTGLAVPRGIKGL